MVRRSPARPSGQLQTGRVSPVPSRHACADRAAVRCRRVAAARPVARLAALGTADRRTVTAPRSTAGPPARHRHASTTAVDGAEPAQRRPRRRLSSLLGRVALERQHLPPGAAAGGPSRPAGPAAPPHGPSPRPPPPACRAPPRPGPRTTVDMVEPERSTTSSRKVVRRSSGSSSVISGPGRASASGIPGRPAPEPTSPTGRPAGPASDSTRAVQQVPLPQPGHLARPDQPAGDPVGRRAARRTRSSRRRQPLGRAKARLRRRCFT